MIARDVGSATTRGTRLSPTSVGASRSVRTRRMEHKEVDTTAAARRMPPRKGCVRRQPTAPPLKHIARSTATARRAFLVCDLSVCVSCSGFSHRAALRRAACLSKQEHAFVHPRGWKNRLSCESRVEEHTIETDPIKYDLEEAHSRGAKWLCSRRPDSKAAAGGARSIAT